MPPSPLVKPPTTLPTKLETGAPVGTELTEAGVIAAPPPAPPPPLRRDERPLPTPPSTELTAPTTEVNGRPGVVVVGTLLIAEIGRVVAVEGTEATRLVEMPPGETTRLATIITVSAVFEAPPWPCPRLLISVQRGPSTLIARHPAVREQSVLQLMICSLSARLTRFRSSRRSTLLFDKVVVEILVL